MDKYELLKRHFGYDGFRPGQEALIEHILIGKDALGIMPTSGGKSLCYQLPALMIKGITIVVSPLIALMKDQVDGLIENGIDATFINSTMTQKETQKRMHDISLGIYKLIYVAPERLLNESFLNCIRKMDVSLIAVDEAHCISQWGHDFRPSYLDVPKFIHRLDKRPIIAAFTATATQFVIEEIKQLLTLIEPFQVVTGFDRSNLFYKVIKPNDPFKTLLSYLENKELSESGIIYCSTRKTVESLYEKLSTKGYAVGMYHAGFPHEHRNCVQDDFMMDRIQIVIATNAFGMGIDKPDVRFVYHYNMPQNMEAYYQEAGRAGRDGQPSECILVYSPADIIKQKMLIAQNTNRDTIGYENLQTLVNYCHTNDCLRYEIISYFGELPPNKRCNNCGNCTDDYEVVDMTVESQKVLSCIYRTGQRYGVNVIIQVLRGSKNKKITDWQLDKISTYGIIPELSEGALRELIMHLIAKGCITMTTDAFPILKLNNESKAVLKGDVPVYIRKEHVLAKPSKKEHKHERKIESDGSLLALLMRKRKEISDEKGIPAYVIFHNSTLEEMAKVKPLDKSTFLDVKGVGDKKFENYGEVFMQVIRNYMKR